MLKKLSISLALLGALLMLSGAAANAVPIVNPSVISDSLMHGTVRIELAVIDSALSVKIHSSTDVIVGLRVNYDDGATAGNPTITRTHSLSRLSSSASAQTTSFGFRAPDSNWQLDFLQEFAALPTGGTIELDTQWGSIPKIFVEPYDFEISRGVPEPSAALLFAVGALGVGRVTRRRR